MIEFNQRRIWKRVTLAHEDDAFVIYLDDQILNSPSGRGLRLPTRELTHLIAAEWDQIEFHGKIELNAMPMTRRVFGVVDWLASHRNEATDQIMNYASHETLCHRSPKSSPLAARQCKAWDPILDWAEIEFHAPLKPMEGVMPRPQPEASLINLRTYLDRLSVFSLAAFIDMVTLLGSFVLALAVLHGRLKPDLAWQLSRLEEDWQIEHWGHDQEAHERSKYLKEKFINACLFEVALHEDNVDLSARTS